MNANFRAEMPPPQGADAADRVATSDLMGRLSDEMVYLGTLMGRIERAMCDMIDDRALSMDSDIASTLQQLDLAVQTAGCLAKVTRAASDSAVDGGHDIAPVLDGLALRDLAERLRAPLS